MATNFARTRELEHLSSSTYCIRSIRHHGYYLFYRPSLRGLLISVAAREAICRETVD